MNKELERLLDGDEEMQEMNKDIEKVISSIPNILKHNKVVINNASHVIDNLSDKVFAEGLDVQEVDVMECLEEVTTVLYQLIVAVQYSNIAIGKLGNCTSDDADI